MIVIIVALAAGLAGYLTGKTYILDKYRALRSINYETQNNSRDLEHIITSLRGELESSREALSRLQEKYQAEVPQGSVRELVSLMEKKLNRGVTPARMKLVIQSATPPHGCTEVKIEPLLVMTPGYMGTPTALKYETEGIIVTATGAPAINPENRGQETWFDPGKPVSMTITHAGGKKAVAEGLLPLNQSLIAGDREYHFTIQEGSRSYIDIGFNHCSYP